MQVTKDRHHQPEQDQCRAHGARCTAQRRQGYSPPGADRGAVTGADGPAQAVYGGATTSWVALGVQMAMGTASRVGGTSVCSWLFRIANAVQNAMVGPDTSLLGGVIVSDQ